MAEQTELQANTPITPIVDPNAEKLAHNKMVDDVINKVNNNDFKVYIYCPAMNSPSGGMGVLFNHALILKENGYNPVMIYEPVEDPKASYSESLKRKKKTAVYEPFNPAWMGDNISKLTFQILGNGEILFNNGKKETCAPLTLSVEDFILIPEGFPNIMERIAQLPCKKIVFAQSWFYILNSLPVGQKWQHYGIRDVISISAGITKYLDTLMPGLNIKQYSQSINRNLFKPTKMSDKAPMIAYMPGRGAESAAKTANIIKTFYYFYPQYRWIRFDELKGLSKEEFAERLSAASIALYTDDVAGFGTLPLEAMACGTHVVGWTPLGSKEYIKETNGFWAANGDMFQIAELLGHAVEKLMIGSMDLPEVNAEYEATLANYTVEKEKESILNIYSQYKTERVAELQQLKRA